MIKKKPINSVFITEIINFVIHKMVYYAAIKNVCNNHIQCINLDWFLDFKKIMYM